MKIGLVFPQTEYPADAAAIGDYAQVAEELGFNHILAYDHILGANPQRPGGWDGPYTYQHSFQEPLVMFSFMAGLTRRLEFATGVIILPQRQTAVFAKQAATLDVLSGGRLRLGVGLGWNAIEYEALNENFHNRGQRLEEQVQVLRLLWTQPLATYEGRWHHIPDAGLNPLPLQRPIPIWIGAFQEKAIRRAAQIGDGWMPGFRRAADAQSALEMVWRTLEEAGRPRHGFGIEPRFSYGDGNPDTWRQIIQEWTNVGATHISFNTMGSGFLSPDQHLQAIRRLAEIIADFH